MDCDDCMKITCAYRNKKKNCTEIVRIKEMKIKQVIDKIKEEGYIDFEGMR